LLVDYIAFHKSVEKLAYVLMGIFSNLFKTGYCKKQEGEPQEGEDEMVSGTGMGEGKGGEKDISDDIKDEEDLLGAKEQKKEWK